jgi:hypothetical protein
MIASKPILGFVLGITLIGLALMSVPGIVGVRASEETTASCPMAEVSLDQGYGVSGVELRRVCGRPE